MEDRNICPELRYRRTADGIALTACYGADSRIFLPDEIGGTPVTEIAPYAFSGGEESTEDAVWLSDEAYLYPIRRRLAALDITELHLPRYVSEIGRYAFYRCRNLEKLTLADGILEIGGGALNGCRIREVGIRFYRGERSALKSILDEIRFAVHARLYYNCQGKEEDVRAADVLFPEHYEEAVENTPARILYTKHHGAGGYYRQCFYNRELDYKRYDELFPRAVAEETPETVLRLALGRLRYPYRLSAEAKDVYGDYVRDHMDEAARVSVADEDTSALRFFSEQGYWTREALESGIDCAAQQGKTEILSLLMDERRRRFSGKRKTFEL